MDKDTLKKIEQALPRKDLWTRHAQILLGNVKGENREIIPLLETTAALIHAKIAKVKKDKKGNVKLTAQLGETALEFIDTVMDTIDGKDDGQQKPLGERETRKSEGSSSDVEESKTKRRRSGRKSIEPKRWDPASSTGQFTDTNQCYCKAICSSVIDQSDNLMCIICGPCRNCFLKENDHLLVKCASVQCKTTCHSYCRDSKGLCLECEDKSHDSLPSDDDSIELQLLEQLQQDGVTFQIQSDPNVEQQLLKQLQQDKENVVNAADRFSFGYRPSHQVIPNAPAPAPTANFAATAENASNRSKQPSRRQVYGLNQASAPVKDQAPPPTMIPVMNATIHHEEDFAIHAVPARAPAPAPVPRSRQVVPSMLALSKDDDATHAAPARVPAILAVPAPASVPVEQQLLKQLQQDGVAFEIKCGDNISTSAPGWGNCFDKFAITNGKWRCGICRSVNTAEEAECSLGCHKETSEDDFDKRKVGASASTSGEKGTKTLKPATDAFDKENVVNAADHHTARFSFGYRPSHQVIPNAPAPAPTANFAATEENASNRSKQPSRRQVYGRNQASAPGKDQAPPPTMIPVMHATIHHEDEFAIHAAPGRAPAPAPVPRSCQVVPSMLALPKDDERVFCMDEDF